MSVKNTKMLPRLNPSAVLKDYRSYDPLCYGAKAAIVGRSGYPVCVLWLPDGRYITKVVPRGDNGCWSIREVASSLRDLLEEYELQVDTVLYEVPWLRADSETVSLLQTCQSVAVGWARLHEHVVAQEIRLHVRAPRSYWTETWGPTSDAHRQYSWRRSSQDIDALDHLLVFAGADAGRIALKIESDELRDEDPEIA